jgi:low temperature requirement protein LtrA
VTTPNEPDRVTILELFFDLVFVFTITQLTTVLFERPDLRGILQVILMLSVIWWMYGGYAWMTNAVRADTAARRLLLLGGMAGYLVLSLAIPSAFSGSGLAFGLAYLLVVLIHSVLFTRAAAVSAARAILTLAPYNLGAALVVVLGGALGGRPQYILWAAAALLEWLTPVIRGTSGFVIGATHFVERHALVMIIAIGESVVAIGLGASSLPVNASLTGIAVLGLSLSACLWWVYFSGYEERAERALDALPVAQRAYAAVVAYGYWFLPMLFGIVAASAVERHSTAHPFDPISWGSSFLLAGGITAYCAGNAFFRRELRLDGVGYRFLVAVLALALAPLGAKASPAIEIGALAALLGAMFLAERTQAARTIRLR